MKYNSVRSNLQNKIVMETLVNVYFKINRFSDIRPYKCKFCDYYARTNSQLKVHMMRHQGNVDASTGFCFFLTFSIFMNTEKSSNFFVSM